MENNTILTHLIAPVAWALTQFLWQGSLVALVLSAAHTLQRRSPAAWRYRSACCALAIMVALPIITALSYDASSRRGAHPEVQPIALESATGTVETRTFGSETGSASGADAAVSASSLGERFASLLPAYSRLRPWIFAAWLAGVLALSVFHVAGWRRVQRLKHRRAQPAPKEWKETAERICDLLGVPRAVRVLKSACVEVPTVIGWLSPIVLIPASAFTGLAPEQLRDILVHEIAHVKRRDYLVNLMQVVAETLLFYHPAVWWVSRRIRVERENCCDDVVVVMSEDRIGYARALVRLEEIRLSQPQFAMRADGGSLVRRIRRLSGGGNMSNGQNKPWLAGVLLASLLVIGGAAFSLAVDRRGGVEDEINATTVASVDSRPDLDKDFAIEGRWELDRYGTVPVIEIRIRERRNRMTMSIEFDEDDFTGLDYGEDDEFELRRDAGTLYFEGDFDGSGRGAEGDGRFGFIPNDKFAKRVGGRLDEKELLILAAKDVGFGYIEEMERMGYERLDGYDLVPLAIHGVSVDYVKAMRASGYDLSLDDLVSFRIHGVSPEFVEEMAELGYEGMSADTLLKWRIHGVSPEFVREMKEAGVGPLSNHDLVKMKIHGVSPEFVEGMADAGFKSLDTDELVKWRIHGVSPEYVRAMKAAGVDDMSVEDLTRMRIHGVSPEYVRELKELGYENVDVDDLVRMRIHGVSPRYIRNVLDKVKEPPSVDDLVKMKIHGIYL